MVASSKVDKGSTTGLLDLPNELLEEIIERCCLSADEDLVLGRYRTSIHLLRVCRLIRDLTLRAIQSKYDFDTLGDFIHFLQDVWEGPDGSLWDTGRARQVKSIRIGFTELNYPDYQMDVSIKSTWRFLGLKAFECHIGINPSLDFLNALRLSDGLQNLTLVWSGHGEGSQCFPPIHYFPNLRILRLKPYAASLPKDTTEGRLRHYKPKKERIRHDSLTVLSIDEFNANWVSPIMHSLYFPNLKIAHLESVMLEPTCIFHWISRHTRLEEVNIGCSGDARPNNIRFEGLLKLMDGTGRWNCGSDYVEVPFAPEGVNWNHAPLHPPLPVVENPDPFIPGFDNAHHGYRSEWRPIFLPDDIPHTYFLSSEFAFVRAPIPRKEPIPKELLRYIPQYTIKQLSIRLGSPIRLRLDGHIVGEIPDFLDLIAARLPDLEVLNLYHIHYPPSWDSFDSYMVAIKQHIPKWKNLRELRLRWALENQPWGWRYHPGHDNQFLDNVKLPLWEEKLYSLNDAKRLAQSRSCMYPPFKASDIPRIERDLEEIAADLDVELDPDDKHQLIDLFERCNEPKVAKSVRALAEAAPQLRFFAFTTNDLARSHWDWKVHRTTQGIVRFVTGTLNYNESLKAHDVWWEVLVGETLAYKIASEKIKVVRQIPPSNLY